MPNYRDDLLAQLLQLDVYQGGSGARRQASMQASLGEDAMLRAQLGSRRRRPEGMPQGAYSLAYYPQINFALEQAEAGGAPTGRGGGRAWLEEAQDPELRARNEQKRKDWALYQNRLLGRQPQYEDKTYEEMRSWNRSRRNR